jgi:hypothetical protein
MNQDPPETDLNLDPEQRAAEVPSAAPTPSAMAPTGLAEMLPKDLGVMLVSAGLIGVVLPGPGAPALVAGGLILWPKGFGKVERWFQKRFPETHRKGLGHINRFLADLERRYPGSTGTAPTRRDAQGSDQSQ